VRKLLLASSATFTVLVATGIYQAFEYRPTAEMAWGSSRGRGAGPPVLYRTTELLHRWSAFVLVGLVIAIAVVRATRAAKDHAWSMANVALGAVAVTAVAGIVTGPMLRWDQLALWAVTVASDIRGVFWSDSVKYVLRGSQELGVGEFRRNVWLHVLVFPLVAAGGIGVLWYACRRGPAPTTVPEREEVTT
jgi:quinol-cytochrome oxidoreductase complex cytochrome b subunit